MTERSVEASGRTGVGGALFSAIPALSTPVIILGGILGGVFTPTEAAASAVMYMVFLGCCYRSLSWKSLGVVMILNLVIGLITPPAGLVLNVLSSVTDASMPTIMRGIVPFLFPLIVTLLIVTFLPQVSLWLPTWLAS